MINYQTSWTQTKKQYGVSIDGVFVKCQSKKLALSLSSFLNYLPQERINTKEYSNGVLKFNGQSLGKISQKDWKVIENFLNS